MIGRHLLPGLIRALGLDRAPTFALSTRLANLAPDVPEPGQGRARQPGRLNPLNAPNKSREAARRKRQARAPR